MNTTNTSPTNPMISNEWLWLWFVSLWNRSRESLACWPHCPPTFRIETQPSHHISLSLSLSLSLICVNIPSLSLNFNIPMAGNNY